jgi:hypothetical protein
MPANPLPPLQKHGVASVRVFDHAAHWDEHELLALDAHRGDESIMCGETKIVGWTAMYPSAQRRFVLHECDGSLTELSVLGEKPWHALEWAVVAVKKGHSAFDDVRIRKWSASVWGDYSVSPCVYAISDGHGRCKIGKAHSAKRRLSALQTGNALKLRVVAVVDCGSLDPSAVESSAHRLAKPRAIAGEWFRLSDCEAEAMLCEVASNYGISGGVLCYSPEEKS